MRQLRVALAALALVALVVAASAPALAVNSDDSVAQTGVASEYGYVILADPPVASWPGAPRVANGKIDFNTGEVGRYQAALARARNAFKDWLRRSGSRARVIREYDTVLNALALKLNGTSLDALRAGPGVVHVEPSATFAPLMNRSIFLINAPALWAAVGGAANAGAGVKVGVIDTGIDRTHPFIDDPAMTAPPGFPKFDPGQAAFTSAKVIVARVYSTILGPGQYTAQDFRGHGTHVSGTIAGVNGTTALAPANGSAPTITGLSGVAPKAWLGNYNVFPSTVQPILGGSAFSHDIAKAIEDAVRDGMDVINMSLGGGIDGLHDQLTIATNRAVDAGVVVAVAAGNAGPRANTVSSPGQADKAITAAASTNNHYFGITVSVAAIGTTGAATFNAAVGAFNRYDPPVTAPLANWNNTAAGAGNTLATRGCSPLSGTPHTGQIVVIDRGTCTFTTKVRNAQNAGAVGVLIANSVAGDPIAMAHDGTSPFPTIPAVMLALSDRSGIRMRAAAGATATGNGITVVEVVTANGNILAGFSSRGPSNLLDLKPDVAAPGVNVYSSVSSLAGGGFAMFQGTSMSTPHVSGAAALLRQLHPSWTPAQIKSALVNSASRPANLGGPSANPTRSGGGLINLATAGAVTATLDPASLSFRKIEPESGRSKSVEVTVTNTTSVSQTYSLSVGFTGVPQTPPNPPATDATITVNPSTLTLGIGASAVVTVTVDTTHDTPSGQHWGDLTVTTPTATGSSPLKAPFWFAVRTTVDSGPLN